MKLLHPSLYYLALCTPEMSKIKILTKISNESISKLKWNKEVQAWT